MLQFQKYATSSMSRNCHDFVRYQVKSCQVSWIICPAWKTEGKRKRSWSRQDLFTVGRGHEQISILGITLMWMSGNPGLCNLDWQLTWGTFQLITRTSVIKTHENVPRALKLTWPHSPSIKLNQPISLRLNPSGKPALGGYLIRNG